MLFSVDGNGHRGGCGGGGCCDSGRGVPPPRRNERRMVGWCVPPRALVTPAPPRVKSSPRTAGGPWCPCDNTFNNWIRRSVSTVQAVSRSPAYITIRRRRGRMIGGRTTSIGRLAFRIEMTRSIKRGILGTGPMVVPRRPVMGGVRGGKGGKGDERSRNRGWVRRWFTRYRGRLVVLRGQRALLELLIDIVRLRRGLNVHKRHGSARTPARHTVQRTPRHDFNTLHATISFKMFYYVFFSDVIR
uniref:Uncharacterized protein n=2 Tax=Cacopsylla melanoneura TaxID=428564 RepID=A0A8D9AQI6_9HEMI